MAVVKVVEIVGQSGQSFQDAVQQAVNQASKSFKNISGVEVANWTAQVKGGSIVEYKADVKLAYAEEV